MILEVTIVAYPCLLMLKYGKKIPGTAGRKLNSRSNLWYPPFQTFISCALLDSHFVMWTEKEPETMCSFLQKVS